MTDKEKLLGGIKLIQSACHNTAFVVEDFTDEDFNIAGQQQWKLASFIGWRSWVRIPVPLSKELQQEIRTFCFLCFFFSFLCGWYVRLEDAIFF